MPALKLREPDWDNLVGETEEVSWIADRDRKVALLADTARQLTDAAAELKKRGALFKCTVAALREVPFAADWYVSLAGFSLKTLGNVSEGPKRHGLKRSVKGLVESLREGPSRADKADLAAFCAWVSEEIAKVYPPGDRDAEGAVVRVALLLGGRVIGQGQNLGGSEAVLVAKTLLADRLSADGAFEVEAGRSWKAARTETELAAASRVRFRGKIVCEFVGGGNRPDVRIEVGDVVAAVGEVKGRKDLSNVWESWMPQVADHMRTWGGEFPDAARLFLGTVVTADMVRGQSARGTARTGLRGLHQQGLLTSAYNLSKVVLGDARATAAFDELAARLLALAGER